MASQLAARRVLVVGASSGIGRATALAGVAAGAAVAVAARRAALLDELVTEAAAAGGAAVALACDVREPEQVAAMVASAVEALGGLDGVVYAAGINRLALLCDTDAAIWRDLFDTNVIGAALVARAALPELRARRGRIALLSSDSVAHPFPALGAYAASKAALEVTAASLRQEEPDIDVGCIVVGPTLTGMASDWDPDLSRRMFDRWVQEGRFDGVTPMEPDVVANRIVDWLAADDPPDDVDLSAAASQ